MIKFKVSAAVTVAALALGTASAANANCALSSSAKSGTLMTGDFLWFNTDSAKKAGAGIKNTYREFTDTSWAGQSIIIEPKGTRASYVLSNGSHGWLPEGQQSPLPEGTVGVGCYPVKPVKAASAKAISPADVIAAPATYSGTFAGAPAHAGKPGSLKVNADKTFTYTYNSGPQTATWTFNGKVDRAGGKSDGNPTLNWTIPDGNELRFEWQDAKTVKVEFWNKGMKAGQLTNKPAQAWATFTKR